MNDLLPDVTVHGTWVRSSVHNGFGRICWRVDRRYGPNTVEFFVMWNGPDKDMGTKGPTADYHRPEDLEVRPYPPKPWLRNPAVTITYAGDYTDYNKGEVSGGS